MTGLVDSSVNFTWSFSGDVDAVDWGLKESGLNDIKNGGVLVSLDKNGSVSVTVPSAYNGRVNGNGDTSSGQVIFTLSPIKSSDQGFYGCRITPTDSFDQQQFDSVYLAIKREYLLAYSQLIPFFLQGGGRELYCNCAIQLMIWESL